MARLDELRSALFQVFLDMHGINNDLARLNAAKSDKQRVADAIIAQIAVHEQYEAAMAKAAQASTPLKPGPTIPQEGIKDVQSQPGELPAKPS